jgi:cytochrome c553
VKSLIKITLIATMMLTTGLASAGDPAAGKAKAAVCAACHGTDGISLNDLWPNLAGQKEGYLKKQITAFRAGTRHDPNMQPMVANLTDADIDNLAAYFSSLPAKP